jgi:acetyl-CoA decarbonylase/synthase, CODH/ACS complex subunit delta
MKYDDIKEKFTGKVNEIDIGGGLKIGGENALGFAKLDGVFPNKPLVAMEINDVYPANWPVELKDSIGDDVLKDPALWAKKCVNDFKADFIFFDMIGTHQDKENISPDTAAEKMNAVLDAVKTPVAVRPAGNNDKKNSVVTKCAEAAKRQVILGSAFQENYRTIVAAALASNHLLIAESPIDVNIAKQLNILITQMNYPLEKVIVDPLTGGLGYGLEYTYSVMERIRLQTFNDDKMMTPPVICLVGQETWRIKEIRLDEKNMGSKMKRGINWEVATAISLILAGANVVVVRHPESVKQIKEFINLL